MKTKIPLRHMTTPGLSVVAVAVLAKVRQAKFTDYGGNALGHSLFSLDPGVSVSFPDASRDRVKRAIDSLISDDPSSSHLVKWINPAGAEVYCFSGAQHREFGTGKSYSGVLSKGFDPEKHVPKAPVSASQYGLQSYSDIDFFAQPGREPLTTLETAVLDAALYQPVGESGDRVIRRGCDDYGRSDFSIQDFVQVIRKHRGNATARERYSRAGVSRPYLYTNETVADAIRSMLSKGYLIAAEISSDNTRAWLVIRNAVSGMQTMRANARFRIAITNEEILDARDTAFLEVANLHAKAKDRLLPFVLPYTLAGQIGIEERADDAGRVRVHRCVIEKAWAAMLRHSVHQLYGPAGSMESIAPDASSGWADTVVARAGNPYADLPLTVAAHYIVHAESQECHESAKTLYRTAALALISSALADESVCDRPAEIASRAWMFEKLTGQDPRSAKHTLIKCVGSCTAAALRNAASAVSPDAAPDWIAEMDFAAAQDLLVRSSGTTRVFGTLSALPAEEPPMPEAHAEEPSAEEHVSEDPFADEDQPSVTDSPAEQELQQPSFSFEDTPPEPPVWSDEELASYAAEPVNRSTGRPAVVRARNNASAMLEDAHDREIESVFPINGAKHAKPADLRAESDRISESVGLDYTHYTKLGLLLSVGHRAAG